MLTKDLLGELFDIDPMKGKIVWRKNRRCGRKGKRAGWQQGRYRSIEINGKAYREHVLMWLHFYGEYPDKEVDHINGNPTDNRITNLRLVDHGQNMRSHHRKIKKDGLPVGVRIDKKCPNNPYMAWISCHKKRICLGYFKTVEQANEAYLRARKEYHPEYLGERIAEKLK